MSELRPDTPPDLVTICRKMMARQPFDRYQTADDVVSALRQWRPPPRKPKRLPERRASDSSGEFNFEGLPSINIAPAPKPPSVQDSQPLQSPPPADSQADQPQGTTKQAGLLATRRQKLIATIACSVVVLLVATAVAVPLILASRSGNDKPAASGDDVTKKTAGKTEKTPADDGSATQTKTGTTPPPDPVPPDPVPPDPVPPDPVPPDPVPPDPPPDPPDPPPKKPEPFSALADRLDLPLLPTGTDATGQPRDPVELGELYIPEGGSWEVELIGGESACKGIKRFALAQGTRGESVAWTVQFGSAVRTTATTPDVDVGQLWNENDRLMFQWLDTAEAETANGLCNCALIVRVGSEERFLPLAAPAAVPPLTIDLDRGFATSSLRRKCLPESDDLRLEITKWDGAFPGHVENPQGPIAPKAPIDIVFQRQDQHGNAQPMMAFRLTFSTKATEIASSLRLTQPSRRQVNFRPFRNVGERNQAQNVRDEMAKQVEKEKNPQKQAIMQRQLIAFDAQLWYADQYEALSNKGKLQYRVYIEPDDDPAHQIELVNSELYQPDVPEADP